jgi:ring-1,2-phenylacetyl-CoA epoxidase subunit PaaE
MVTDAIDVLGGLGVEARRIHRELFWVGDDPPAEATHEEAPAGDGATLTVILDGRSSTLTLPAGTAILDGAQKVRPDLPFACKGGVCGTCRALLVKGEVTMRRNYALERSELEAGYVLTCQALPVSDQITVDYDA